MKEEIVPSSYKEPIEDADLKTLIAAGWTETSLIDELWSVRYGA